MYKETEWGLQPTTCEQQVISPTALKTTWVNLEADLPPVEPSTPALTNTL